MTVAQPANICLLHVPRRDWLDAVTGPCDNAAFTPCDHPPQIANVLPCALTVSLPCDVPASVIEARYANHFEVGHNESEFIFDFDQFHFERLDSEAPEPAPQVRIVRIVMGPPFAKSLLERCCAPSMNMNNYTARSTRASSDPAIGRGRRS